MIRRYPIPPVTDETVIEAIYAEADYWAEQCEVLLDSGYTYDSRELRLAQFHLALAIDTTRHITLAPHPPSC